MLKVRVIPTLLWKEFGLVKGCGFDSWRRVGAVLPAIKVYNQRDVDELFLADVLANQGNRDIDLETVAEIGSSCYVPFTFGGGIKNIQQVQLVLESGADKISVNSYAFEHPQIITEIANRYGSQSIVGSIDVKSKSPSSWECFSHSGKHPTGRNVLDWAQELEARGVGEILLTSIDRDGTMAGYDVELLAQVANKVKIPIIASGGAGNYQHMIQAVKEGGASAVAAASIFHFTEMTPEEAKIAMRKAGIPTRC